MYNSRQVVIKKINVKKQLGCHFINSGSNNFRLLQTNILSLSIISVNAIVQ